MPERNRPLSRLVCQKCTALLAILALLAVAWHGAEHVHWADSDTHGHADSCAACIAAHAPALDAPPTGLVPASPVITAHVLPDARLPVGNSADPCPLARGPPAA